MGAVALHEMCLSDCGSEYEMCVVPRPMPSAHRAQCGLWVGRVILGGTDVASDLDSPPHVTGNEMVRPACRLLTFCCQRIDASTLRILAFTILFDVRSHVPYSP